MKFWLVGTVRVYYPVTVRKRYGGLPMLVLKTNVALQMEVKIFVIGRQTHLDNFRLRCSTNLYDVPFSYPKAIVHRMWIK